MKRFAFVFPGQGSQALGMLDAFTAVAAVQTTVAEASEVLGFDLAHMVSQGPKDVLDLTTNTQPIMLTAGVAFYRAWLAAGGETPAMVAGHSLGEYSALVASGSLSFRDALLLVRFRAEAMQRAVPVGQGSMAAILGLSDQDVRSACAKAAVGQVVEAVNYNAPMQVVIAGHAAAVDRACALALEKGAKRALPLAVSAPFHSSLMLPAAEQLRSYLATVECIVPQVTLVNNVDVAVSTDEAGVKDALSRQAASPVRWVETIRYIASHGNTHVIECGPGKVLTGLTKRIDPALVGDAIASPAAIEHILELLK
ncbi:MAG: ACP S-malonyltransferase [Pseudomonadota bacterium]